MGRWGVHTRVATGRALEEGAGCHAGGVIRTWLGINPSEALFSTRGFPPTSAQARLESAGMAFISGYNFGLVARDAGSILAHVQQGISSERGFIAEGAAMAAAIRTALTPWKDRLGPVLALLSDGYPHLAHVGVGWATARVPFARPWLLRRLDPRLTPLAMDGRGFHDGYFHSPEPASRRRPAGDWGRIYDQGLGRSLWFSCGADPYRLHRAVASADPTRSDDLWAGIGLACVYAGGTDSAKVQALRRHAGPSLRWMRQGAAFAVSAHARGGGVPHESALAASTLCQTDVGSLIRIVDDAFDQVPGPQPRTYQEWRRRVADVLDHAGRGATR